MSAGQQPMYRSTRVLEPGDLPEALALARLDPVANALALSPLEEAYATGRLGNQLWGLPHNGPLEAVCWAGANLVPVIPGANPWAIGAFAAHAAHQGRRVSSIVGPAEQVLGLWELLRHIWPTPREIRANQPSMAISTPALIAQDITVRFAQDKDFGALFPASVAMFEEEVGVSPLRYGPSQYVQRVRSLIDTQRTLVRMAAMPLPQEGALDQVIFKADFGVVTREVAQVQGVWVNPKYRGLGLASPAMAAVVNLGLVATAPTISLYVNDFNHRALATYRSVGFEQVGTFATIMF